MVLSQVNKLAEPAWTQASQLISWCRTVKESTSCSQKGKAKLKKKNPNKKPTTAIFLK